MTRSPLQEDDSHPLVLSAEKERPSEDLSYVWLRIAAFLSLKSETTQRTYKGIITEWCRFIRADPGSIAGARAFVSVTDLDATAYREWLSRRPGQKPRLRSSEISDLKEVETKKRRPPRADGLQSTHANATIAKKFTALRRIYRMLLGAGLMTSRNPFDVDAVPLPPARSGRKRPTEMVEFERVEEMLALPDPMTPRGLRDKALLSVLFAGGLRRSEAAGLRVGDVRRSSKGTAYLVLRATKGKRDAEQALPPWAAKTVLELVRSRERQGAEGGDYLFISYRGRNGDAPSNAPISHDGIYRLFKNYSARSGAENATPHSARATAITKLLDDGVSFRDVREFSRHSSVQMVEAYDKRRTTVDENPGRALDFGRSKGSERPES